MVEKIQEEKDSYLDLIKFKNNMTEEKNKIVDEKQENDDIQKAVFLFFSFDLVNSTVFKTEHPSLWSSVFTCFYNEVLINLGVEGYKTPDNDSECIRKLWKLIGDEVLIYVNVTQTRQLYAQVSGVGKVLDGLLDIIADRVIEQSKEPESGICTHCQDIKKVILSTLGIKVTAWLAECGKDTNHHATNIVYYPNTTTSRHDRIDFLGKDIDEGFRIAEYAVKNKIILSPLLAWLIWKEAEEDADNKKIIESNFKITTFANMKGVWRGRKVPIIMYHQNFENFDEVLEYDELDCDTYANIRECGISKFRQEKRFRIKEVDNILNDIHKKYEAEEVYKRLKSKINEDTVRANIDRSQEFHIACMIFMKDGNLLIHDDSDRGLEFGCITKMFGIGKGNWQKACEEGYKDKYKISIKVDECPVPIATYYYGKKNAIGIIILAECLEDEIIDNNEWIIMTSEEIEKYEGPMVDKFKENVKKAIKIKEEV